MRQREEEKSREKRQTALRKSGAMCIHKVFSNFIIIGDDSPAAP
jgi:hypothetical protein